jgi:peptide chain release factor 3
MDLASEVARRRTFAIISHPDAGKTTLTEKLLLYSGALRRAGSVRPNKSGLHATSDWMAMEQARGISITSTALQFEHGGCLFNLLDTPGHEDFSEDTYRTLTAVDSAVMVLDAAKGIEPQTRKLFQVCSARKIPILTFINKLDHPARDPLGLLDEVERVLGIRAAAMNWPVGDGPAFRGVFDLANRRLLRYVRVAGGQHKAEQWETTINDPAFSQAVGADAFRRLQDELALLDAAGEKFEMETFLAGRLTPVYFGSALHNFGVETFLDALVSLAPPPQPRQTTQGAVTPCDGEFSAFVFKIQANMDPRHRDRMAFLRVCSGRFEKDMSVYHTRLGRKIQMTRSHRLFARDRETLIEAFPGDVVGVVNPGIFVIGDTVTEGSPIGFPPIPTFPPENFGLLRNRDVSKNKQFRKGIQQLEEEGVIQLLFTPGGGTREPILAAVGRLQFDVVEARLLQEYGVSASVDPLSYSHARWLEGEPGDHSRINWPYNGFLRATDRRERCVCLFESQWTLQHFAEKNPGVAMSETG